MAEDIIPKILIVDDQKNNLFLLENIISSIDAKIYTTTSPTEAIELINNEEFALIITDVQMPGMNGFQMLQKIREREENQYIPVIFISAIYTQDEHILKGIKTGAIDFIPKPFNHEILLGKVKTLLQLYSQRKKLESFIVLLNNLYKEISEKNKIIEKITQSTNDAIFLLNENFNIIYYNNQALSLFKLTDNNIHNNNSIIKNLFISKELFDSIFLSLKDKEKEKTITLETDCITTSKDTFPAEITVSCFLIDEKLHYLLFIRDISERKLNEKRLLKTKEIKEANKVMAEFIDKINHELNTPINSIKGILKNLLQHEKIVELNNDVNLSLQLAFNQIKNLENFIKNVLQFKEKYIITKNEIKLSCIIEDIKEFCEELKEKKNNYNITLEYNNDILNLTLFTNKNKLLYTFLNVIELFSEINNDKTNLNIKFYKESNFFIAKFHSNNLDYNFFQQNFEIVNVNNNLLNHSLKTSYFSIKQNIEALKGELIFEKNNNNLILKLPIE